MRTIITFVFLLSSLSIFAQDVQSFSLEEAIEYALQNTVEIKNAQINIADAEEQIVERRAIGIPQVNAGVAYNYFIELPVSLVPGEFFGGNPGEFAEVQFGTTNSLTASLEAQALIFDGSYFVGLRAAKEARSYAQDQFSQTKADITQRVREAYYPALIIQSNLNTLDKNIANLNTLLIETKKLNEEGFVELLDVDRLVLSISNLEIERENLSRQHGLAQNLLKFTMGFPLEEDIETTDNIESLAQEVPAEDLLSKINFNQRADYRLLDRAISLNNLNVELNKAAYLPTLAGFASYQYQGQGDNLFKNAFWNPTSVAGLQLNVPVFSGLMRNAKLNRAKLQLETIQNQKSQLENAIVLEVFNARGNYLSAQRRVEAQKKNVALAQRIYDTSQIKYKEGVGSSIEINQAESSLFTTQQNYTQALFELLNAKTALDKALGK